MKGGKHPTIFGGLVARHAAAPVNGGALRAAVTRLAGFDRVIAEVAEWLCNHAETHTHTHTAFSL